MLVDYSRRTLGATLLSVALAAGVGQAQTAAPTPKPAPKIVVVRAESPDAIRKLVRQHVKYGADVIKVLVRRPCRPA